MAGPVSGRRIKRRVMRNFLIVLVALIAIAGTVAGINFYMGKITKETQQEEQANYDVAAVKYVNAVSTIIKPKLDEITKLSSDASLHSAFQNKESLPDKANELKQQIKDALQVRLFFPGDYQVDRESKPPLGFASIDLLRQAEKSDKELPLEVHAYGSADAHLVVIRRVKDDAGKLIGLLHVSLAVDPYLKLPMEPQSNDGYVELVQLIGTNNLVIQVAGNKSFRHGNPVKKKIPGTQWAIDYWPPVAAVTTTEKTSGTYSNFLLPIGGVLIIVILLATFLIMRRGSSSETPREGNENVVYGGAIKAIMDGLHPGLEKLVPNLPKSKGAKPVVPLSKGMQGDDVTRIATSEKVNEVAQQATGKPAVKKPAAPATTPTQQKKPAPTAPQKPVAPAPAATAPKPEQSPAPAATATPKTEIPDVIFRQYDIRGVVGKSLNTGVVTEIGKAIGSEAKARNQDKIIVGRDGRDSGLELVEGLISGLRSTGCNVTDIGMVPTPVLYFATHHLETGSGVMVTGSHNGPEYNGLKIVLGGETLSGEAIQGIKQRIAKKDYVTGQGSLQTADIVADYVRRATEDIPVALGGSYKLVIDCGNGIPGMVAPQIYKALGHDVVELYCDVDGKFPNHHPDPSQPDNLRDLIAKVKETGADLGFAFDGDGDRLGVVDAEGIILWPDRQMMLFAKDVLERNQGATIIYDVKCSRSLKTVIEESGGVPMMWKTGHSLIKNKMKECSAPLAGEMSGHIFFAERWYGFDDALYAGARLLEILTKTKSKPAEVFAGLPGGVATPEIRIPLAEKHHQKFMQALIKKAAFPDADISDIDGIRVDFSDRWGLIRPSNTTPCLIARFEADNDAGLEKVKSDFRSLIQSITPDLKLPF